MIVNGLGDIDVYTPNQPALFPGVAQWGAMEWGIIAVGLYILYSTYSTTSHHVGTVRGAYSRSKSKAERRRKLEQELREL